jgi:hypothetical protein
MQTFRDCINIGVDARVIYLELSKDFARRGSQDIYPEALAVRDADDYERETLETLQLLATSRTGRALFWAIRAAWPRCVLIRPVTEIDRATSFFRTPSAEAWNAMSGHPITSNHGFPANSLVNFTPGWLDKSNRAPPGMRSDEVLLHELVHSLRHLTGLSSIQPMGDGFDSVEEFMAILVSNIFASEVDRPLRGGHHAVLALQGRAFTLPLDPTLHDPRVFLSHSNFRQLVEQFVREHLILSFILAMMADIQFNPFAAL